MTDTSGKLRDEHVVADPKQAFWGLSTAELFANLQSSAAGLSTREAANRLKSVGPNILTNEARLAPMRLLVRQFESPLVLILLFGAVISMSMRNWTEAWIILAIIAGSGLLGFFQEYRASRTVAELTKRLALTSRVLRDGRETTLPARDLVPGDVVLLSAGALVPADCLILEAEDLLVNEASLTGESFPAEKMSGTVSASAGLTERTNAVFLGSSVQSGTARALVAETGQRTAFGAIAVRLQEKMPETDFAQGVRKFGYLLVRVMVVIVLFVLAVNQLSGRPAAESLLFAVALAVGLSPELLPAIISVTLSAGARALAGRGVIVRRLEVIENLGSMNVLCTDKTGTLTEGVITLSETIDTDGHHSDSVLKLAFFNAALEAGIENPLDAAILAAGLGAGLSSDKLKKVDEIPYDFHRKCLTIVLENPKEPAQHLMVVKGAFSSIMAKCSDVLTSGGRQTLSDEIVRSLQALYEQKSAGGFRVLALATRTFEPRTGYRHDDEAALTFEGLLLFLDPAKSDVRGTIADLAGLGVEVKVISGDNRFITAHLAETVGIDSQLILTGEDLSGLGDEALWHRAPRTSLFVEVDPQQKERIVRALQRSGHTVGYMGDGINDAPALHAADVGISVDQAVDTARQSADIILLRRDLDVLRQGIEGGRRTFANTIKYINITTSANFGNMVSMAVAAPLLPFLPLLPKQILLNNFLSDLPSLAISTDSVDLESVSHPQSWDIRKIQQFMILFGLTSSVFDFITFAVLLLVFRVDEAAFQTSWFVVSLLSELAVLLVLRTKGPVLKSRPGRLLLWTTVAVAAVCVLAPYLGGPSTLFGFVTLTSRDLVACLLIVCGYVAVTEALKRWFYRRGFGALLAVPRLSSKR